MSSAPSVGLDAREGELVRHGLSLLGRSTPDGSVERLTQGRSGALVVGLRFGSSEVVLKVTHDPGRRPRAVLELQLLAGADPRRRVLMPRFLAGHEGAGAVFLLIERHRPFPPATTLSGPEWVGLARRLGGLHRLPVPIEPPLVDRPWPTGDELAAAGETWTAFAGVEPARRAFALLADLRERPSGLDDVLAHGDCHTENLVRDRAGRTRWLDWQEGRRGDGLEDLVFLWQRAEAAGAHPPRDAMVTAYAEGRGIPADRACHRGLVRAELLLLLTAWPPFLGYGPVELMRRRLEQLVR